MNTRSVFIVMSSLLFGLGWSPIVIAQSNAEIEAARQKGIEFIKSKQLEDGSWEYEGHSVGITALCAVALVQNGVPVSDPIVSKAYRYVQNNAGEETKTYDIALSILLLTSLDERSNKPLIRDLAARLVVGQLTSGGWTYSCPMATSLVLRNKRIRPKPKVGGGDNSCTQFAVLGLWTASRVGVDIEDNMRLVAQRFVESQNEDGGWSYRYVNADGQREASKDSMTFAGLFSLTVARAAKLRGVIASQDSTSRTAKKENLNEGDLLRNDPIFKKGLERAAQYVKGGSAGRYYLWSCERLGVILGEKLFGRVDWFKKGAAVLLKSQGKDGSWPDSKGGLSDTSFAVLFLRQANLGSDITRLLRGDSEKPFQIVSQPEMPRFKTIVDALKAAKPADTIRVEGDGPYKMPHLVIKQDLTIQSGFGYRPTFQYAIGRNSRGLRARPARDAEARHLIHISGGKVTLEGLKLEMEPPEIGTLVPWTAVKVDGGSLQMLNVTITEQGKKNTAMIEVIGPGRVVIRNCLVAGGRAAIEIVSGGIQDIVVDNTVLFSKNSIVVVRGKVANQSEINLKLKGTTFQGGQAFYFRNIDSSISITSNQNVYKTNWLGGYLLTSVDSKQKRNWQGSQNLYGPLKYWIGANGAPVSKITDLKNWRKFWGIAEEGSYGKAIGFATPRTTSSHRVKPQDWDLHDRLNLPKNRFGIHSMTVGAGRGYSRFRESILYNDWKSGKLDTES